MSTEGQVFKILDETCAGCGQDIFTTDEPGYTVVELDGVKKYFCGDCFGWLVGEDIHWEEPDGPPHTGRRIDL